MHVFISVGMRVAMVVPVPVPMLERKNTDQVHSESGNTDYQKFTDTMHLAASRQPFNCLVDDLNTDYPG